MAAPTLCEPGMKDYLKGSLRECRRFRDQHTTLLFNIGATLVLVAAVAGVMWYRYRGRPTREEENEKRRKTHEYLVSKLQMYSAIRDNARPGMITGLPVWDRQIA